MSAPKRAAREIALRSTDRPGQRNDQPKNKQKPIFYVEAEPLNIDLYSDGHGIKQVNSWLLSRASKTDFGLATDGLKWIFVK